MATTKQKRLAKAIVENATLDVPLNSGAMLEKVGYAKTVAKHKPKEILESDGVLSELAVLGFDEATAKGVVATILADERQASKDRLKAAEMVFKVHGSFKESERPVEKGATNYTFIFNPEIMADVKALEARIKAKLIGNAQTT